HEYNDSALNSTGDDNTLFRTGPADGAPPQNVRLGPDDFLLDHLGAGFTLLYSTSGDRLPEQLQQELAAQRASGVPLTVLAVGTATPVTGADEVLGDADGHLRMRYGMAGTGAAYLLRPDQHICARWLTLDATRLRAAFAAALPRAALPR